MFVIVYATRMGARRTVRTSHVIRNATKKACDSGWIHFAHLIGRSEGAKMCFSTSVRIEKNTFSLLGNNLFISYQAFN